MKAILNDADTFKAVVAKVAPVVKNSASSIFGRFKFEAKDGEFTATATNGIDFLILTLPGRVIEDGVCFIEYDDLKKMTPKGFDIVIEADDRYINISSSGKSYKIANNHLSFPDIPEIEYDPMQYGYISTDILANLKPLSVMADAKATRTLMSAIRFDLSRQRLIALDGHRIGVWNLPPCGSRMVSFTTNLNTVDILKAAIDKYMNGNVSIFCDGKYVKFFYHDDTDFTYITKCVEGEYYNIDTILDTAKRDYDYKFSVSSKELAEIAKEYKRGFKKDEPIPMLIFGSDDAIMTAFDFGSFMTADKLETAKWEYHSTGSNFYKGVNPCFIADACAFLEEDIEFRSKDSGKMAMYLRSGEKEVLILPVNIISDGNELMGFAIEQINNQA